MPVSYEIKADDGYVEARYVGVVTMAEVRTMFETYLGDPDFRTDLTHLVDLSQINADSIGFSEVFALSGMFSRSIAETGRQMRIAIFAPNELTYGLSRMFESLSGPEKGVDARIFNDLAAARCWASRVCA